MRSAGQLVLPFKKQHCIANLVAIDSGSTKKSVINELNNVEGVIQNLPKEGEKL